MSRAPGVKQRIAARDALAGRTRRLTGIALTVSGVLSGVFAGIAGASAPGHKLHPGTTARQTPAAKQRSTASASTRTSTTIPPLPPPPGPGNLSAAPPPAPAPASAPAPTQSPPVVVSGGS